MILIEERVTSKVPGITSFFIQFNYNPQIITVLKNLECKNYSKKTKEWEIPITSLRDAIDGLCVFDDIKLKFLTQNLKQSTITSISSSFKTTPFSHQIDGVLYGLNNSKFLLLDKMGLGKTASSIYLAEELHKTQNLQHCLVVCGINNLKSNWRKEIKTHSNLSCVILGERITRNNTKTMGSVKERIAQLSSPIEEFFIITNVETFRNSEVIDAILNGPNVIDMIIFDEIHTVKDSNSQQGSNILNLKSKHQIGLTGTLLMNNPLDLFVPLHWIDADRSTLTNFKSNYCVYGGHANNMIIGYKNLELLKYQLNEYSLRRDNSLLNLPPKNIIIENIDMNEDQLNFYTDIKNGVKEEVDKVKLTTTSLLALTTRLRQATVCPSILTSKNITSAKINRAKELIDGIISNNDKVVVFSTFKESILQLQKLLPQENLVICTGDTKDEQVEENKEKFQNSSDCKIFLSTWQKCGTGITLTEASYMIFLDTPWTWAVFEQACDRIYRIGTKKPVFIYNIICTNTIDEIVYDILNEKRVLSDFVLDDKLPEESMSKLRRFIETLD